jgi:hypothetical protein
MDNTGEGHNKEINRLRPERERALRDRTEKIE